MDAKAKEFPDGFSSHAVSGWLGVYFMVFRPALLPEDARFIGGSVAEIQALLPRLERWLSRVFGVMGGFMAGAGALTVYVAATAVPPRNRGTGAVLALAGLLTVVARAR